MTLTWGVHTPFVVLFQGRAGSTFLIEALGSHPNIIARGESLIALREGGAEAQNEWTREFFTRERSESCGAIGFKTKLVDVVNPTSFASVLEEAGCRIVHLHRANVVKQAISWIRADVLFARTADWNVYDRAQKLPPTSIPMHEFLGRFEVLERGAHELEQYVHALRLPVCTVSYEQLLVEPEQEFRRLLPFLGVLDRPLRSTCLKNTEDDLRRVVTNFAELRAQLAGTPYESMCDEVLTPSGSR